GRCADRPARVSDSRPTARESSASVDAPRITPAHGQMGGERTMSTASSSIPTTSQATSLSRWIQLVAGVIAMVAIANLQYAWTLFVNPIDSKFPWGKANIQIAFTIFVLAETWLVPFEGYLVDLFGPRVLVAIGGCLVGVAWWINAGASSLFALYAGGFIGGAG